MRQKRPALSKSTLAAKCRSRFWSNRCGVKVTKLMVSRPEVIFRRDENGNLLEPIENLYVEVPNENLGDVMQSLAGRKGEIVGMDHHATSRFHRGDHSDPWV